MPIYNWSGLNQHGKKTFGSKYAKNYFGIKNQLIKQKIYPLKIKRDLKSYLSFRSKIKTKNIAQLIEQLAILINANLPIIKSFNVIKEEEQNSELKNLINHCINSISEGSSLYQAWQQHPQYFNQLSCSLVNAGEQSGTLDSMLLELSNHLKKTQLQKRKIIKSLIYPITTMSVTVLVTIIMLAFVIPQFETMFNDFGTQIPAYTQIILDISDYLQKNQVIILAVITTTSILIKTFYSYSKKFRKLIELIILKLPLVKNILIYTIITRLTKTLSLTLKSGLPLISAINISGATIPSLRYQSAIQQVNKLITNGTNLHQALNKQNLFPTQMIHLIALGEESGTLEVMLKKISDIYQEKLDYITENLNNMLEPIIMIVIGILVGGLVIGMYLPIFRLGMVV